MLLLVLVFKSSINFKNNNDFSAQEWKSVNNIICDKN